MIVTIHRFDIVCDGCGTEGPGSVKSREHVKQAAKAEGWTISPGFPSVQHWCPECTAHREETPS